MKRVLIFFIIVLILAEMGFLTIISSAEWYNTSFGKRVFIYTNPAYPETTLTGFPLAVKLNTSIVLNCTYGGADLRFVALDNTTLYDYEIETWNSTDACVWVNITTINGLAPTGFYLYYNYSTATPYQDSTKVWDNNYCAVYHMNDTSICWDSTKNRNKSTATTGSPIIITSVNKFGNSTLFNGASYFNFGNVNDFTTQDMTLEVIGNATNSDTYPVWMKKYNTATGAGYIFYQYAFTNNGERCQYADNADPFQPAITQNYTMRDWVYFYSCRYNTINGELVGDLDNRGTASNALTGTISTADSFYIARNEFAGTGLKGRIDEVRISMIRRNSSWLNYTWLNLNRTDSVNFTTIEDLPASPTGYIVWSINRPTNATWICPIGFTINLTVSQSMGYPMNITFLSNYSGVWSPINSLLSLSNGSYGVAINNFTGLGIRYYWNATINSTYAENRTNQYYLYTYNDTSNCYPVSGSSSTWVAGLAVMGVMSFMLVIPLIRRRKKL